MTDVLELTRNIETLRGTLDVDLDALLVTTSLGERQALRASIERCTLALQHLLYRLITLPLEARDTVD